MASCHTSPIAAVIAAAGQSRRMGRPKQLLPWGKRTVIETVVANLDSAGAAPVICVIGHLRAEMESLLRSTRAVVVYNETYASTEVLASYQAGVAELSREASWPGLHGALLSLCDQPHVGPEVIRQVIDSAQASPDRIVIPSHNRRRGHPIYLPRRLWPALMALGRKHSLRDLLRDHAEDIVYAVMDSDAILRDMDTPAEYADLRP